MTRRQGDGAELVLGGPVERHMPPGGQGVTGVGAEEAVCGVEARLTSEALLTYPRPAPACPHPVGVRSFLPDGKGSVA